jgi:hypothetical protein
MGELGETIASVLADLCRPHPTPYWPDDLFGIRDSGAAKAESG